MSSRFAWVVAIGLAQGGVAVGGTPEQLAERIKADIAKWGKVARTAGVKIE